MRVERDMDRPLEPSFDKLLMQRIRLEAMSYLARSGGTAPLTEIRAAAGRPSHALMFVHSRQLERAGYITQEKHFVGRLARTTWHLTSKGRAAFEGHKAALAALAIPPAMEVASP
jgi:DNA-binding MarR family transcriptional regulator